MGIASMDDDHGKTDFIELGYKAGTILSFVGILASAVYLFTFLKTSPSPEVLESELKLPGLIAERRMMLLSTAIFVVAIVQVPWKRMRKRGSV